MTLVVLTSDYVKGQMARAVPGSYWDPAEKAWAVEDPSPRAAAVALKLFPQLSADRELVAKRDELLQDTRPFDYATEFYEAMGRPRAGLQAERVRKQIVLQGWSLHKYQEIDLRYAAANLRERGAFYLGWERGLGKTLGTCCLIDELDCHATLVVCPNTAKRPVWAAELARFCPWLEVIVLGNTVAQRNRALLEAHAAATAGRPFVLVVHYEALAVIAGKTKTAKGKTILGDGWKRLKINWNLMVTDEDHRLSNPETQMFKAAKRVPAQKRLLLSGSIIQNHLEELYSPHARAFPDRYSSKWRDWNDRFLDFVENGWGKVCVGVQPDRVDALRAELGAWMAYRRKEDELDLPPLVEEERRIEVSPAQRRAYDELVTTCLTTLPDGEKIKATEGIAMLGKLRQVATGLDLVGEVADSTKLDLAVDLIVDAEDDDFVVFSWYKSAAYKLADRLATLGIEAWVITGDTPQGIRDDMIRRFQAGERRVMIGTLSTMGESVNLQRANNVIFLDRSLNPATNLQARDRVFRQGQTRPVTVTHIIAANTVDELQVLPTLASKEALRAAVLGGV